MRRLIIHVAVIAIFAILVGAAHAEVKAIKMKVGWETIMDKKVLGQRESIAYIAKDMAVLEDENGMVKNIIRSDEKKMYRLNMNDKTYRELPYRDMAQSPKAKRRFIVTQDKETKKIGQYNAKKYTLKPASDIETFYVEFWVTDKIKLPFGVENILLANMSLRHFQDYLLQDMKGAFPLEIRTVSKIRHDVIRVHRFYDIEQIEIEPAIFEIPKDFTKKEIPRVDKVMGKDVKEMMNQPKAPESEQPAAAKEK